MLKIAYTQRNTPSCCEPSLMLSGAGERELRAAAFRLAALLVERAGEGERWIVQTSHNRAYLELFTGDSAELGRACELLCRVSAEYLESLPKARTPRARKVAR